MNLDGRSVPVGILSGCRAAAWRGLGAAALSKHRLEVQIFVLPNAVLAPPNLRGVKLRWEVMVMKRQGERVLRDSRLYLRMTTDELERARALWQEFRPQVTFSQWCRDRILLRKTPRPLFRSLDDERRFLAELGHVGANLNQLARAANVDGTADAVAMRQEAKRLWRLVLQAMQGT